MPRLHESLPKRQAPAECSSSRRSLDDADRTPIYGHLNRTLLPILAVVLAAATLYLATPQSHFFSDGPHMVGLASASPVPHYNVLYAPSGYLFHAVLTGLFEVDTRRALEIHTSVMVALGLFFAGLVLRRYTSSGTIAAGVLAWLALTPATWFFATTIEVHGVQFFGASIALWASHRARESTRPIRWVALAWIAAILGHLTCVILAPFLLWLAVTGDPKRGLTWRQVIWAIVTCSALIGLADLGVWLWTSALGHERGSVGPAIMLWSFIAEFAGHVGRRGLFSFGEVLEYLNYEFWRPGLLLIACLPLTFVPAWRRARLLLVVTLLATLCYLAVFTQGGVWERGAYYFSLYPAYAALIVVALDPWRTRALPVRGLLAVAVGAILAFQGAFAWSEREAFNQGLKPEVWASRVSAIVPEGALVYADELPRAFCLNSMRKHLTVQVVRKELDLWPEKHHAHTARVQLQSAIEVLTQGRTVYFDAGLFDETRDRRRSVRNFTRAVDEEIAKTRVLHREPVRDPSGQLILYVVRWPK